MLQIYCKGTAKKSDEQVFIPKNARKRPNCYFCSKKFAVTGICSTFAAQIEVSCLGLTWI